VVGWCRRPILSKVVARTLCGSRRQVLGVVDYSVGCRWVFSGTVWVSPVRYCWLHLVGGSVRRHLGVASMLSVVSGTVWVVFSMI
jgi:hypothetical protein